MTESRWAWHALYCTKIYTDNVSKKVMVGSLPRASWKLW
jgi:hypothetical protein